MTVHLLTISLMGGRAEILADGAEDLRTQYNACRQKATRDVPDPRLHSAVHALRGHKTWPNHQEHVHSDCGYAYDRSCNPSRCDCEELGLPVKEHPHYITK